MIRTAPESKAPMEETLAARYKEAIYFALKADVEMFLKKFEQENSFNYADFAKVWQATDFTLIFSDQTSLKTLENLCEMCLLVAKKFLTYHPNKNVQIGAFYLLYGFYYKQPIRNLVRIRLTLDDYTKLKKLMDEMLEKGQYDALFIFAKMKSDEAFVYVAREHPLSLVTKTSFLDNERESSFQLSTPDGPLKKLEKLFASESVNLLKRTCQDYEEKIGKFASNTYGFVPFKSHIVSDLEEVYQAVFSNTGSAPQASTEESSRIRIRQKAFANKNARYRGSKKVMTAIDLSEASDEDPDFVP